MLLIGYLIAIVVPVLPAEGLSFITSGKVIKKVCKRSYAVEHKKQSPPLQLKFTATERRVADFPQAEFFLFFGSSITYIPATLESELQLTLHQGDDFAAFFHSLYTILFQELDPDPPRVTFC